MAELKPCPFCGGPAAFISDTSTIKCKCCGGAFIVTNPLISRLEAAEAWNRRAEDGIGVQSKEKKKDICPKCGGELHCDRSTALTTYPVKYRWDCKDCGYFELRFEV